MLKVVPKGAVLKGGNGGGSGEGDDGETPDPAA